MAELQQFQVPNFAADLLTKQALVDQTKIAGEKARNEAAFKLQELGLKEGRFGLDASKFIEEQEATKRKNSIEVNDFALNLLTGVNSTEDLAIARNQFLSRYPQHTELFNQVLPSYSPSAVRLIKNSLRTETQRLKLEELDFSQKLETAKLGLERGKFGLEQRKQTFEEGKPTGFTPGTLIKTPGGQDQQVPTAPPKPDFELFTDSKGNQAYLAKGASVPSGYSRVEKKTGPSVVVQTGDLGKGTRTQVEKDIIEGTRNIQSFQETGKLFKPEYLTYFGKTDKAVAEMMDKAGISTDRQKDLINKRAKWFRQAKADFIAYRKWATGVAGGEKEMAEIATSFPDPLKNSPTQYAANLDSIEETTKRVLQLNADFLRLGIDMDQPLDVIISEAKRKGVNVGLSGDGRGDVTITFTRDEDGNLVRSEE